jgi:diguanylate cyclase (GGDEF)-like protein
MQDSIEYRGNFMDIYDKFLNEIILKYINKHRELVKVNKKLKQLTITDELTQIYNRAHFMNCLNNQIERSLRTDEDFCVLMFDIDYFKKINDTYGHITGDIVLVEICSRIKGMLRRYDVFARYGGEEFIILLSYCTIEQGKTKAQNILEKIGNNLFDIKKEHVKVTISIGLVSYKTINQNSTDKILLIVDKLLYKAKNSGRNKIKSSG